VNVEHVSFVFKHFQNGILCVERTEEDYKLYSMPIWGPNRLHNLLER